MTNYFAKVLGISRALTAEEYCDWLCDKHVAILELVYNELLDRKVCGTYMETYMCCSCYNELAERFFVPIRIIVDEKQKIKVLHLTPGDPIELMVHDHTGTGEFCVCYHLHISPRIESPNPIFCKELLEKISVEINRECFDNDLC